jgi:hypothetical protein
MHRALIVFRVLLYSAAAYVLIDLFLITPNQDQDLKAFKKNPNQTYYEFYFKYNQTDSNWAALRTSPFLGNEIKLKKENPWEINPESIIAFKGYTISGFYLDPDLILDRSSFFIIQKNINSMAEHKDSRLKKLDAYSSITIIFEIK